MALIGFGGATYSLFSATSNPTHAHGLQQYSTGALGKLIVLPDAPTQPAGEFLSGAGEPITLADLRGAPTLVNIWATFCAPCVAEMPALDRLAARYDGRLNVAPISIDQDTGAARASDAVKDFYQQHGLGTLEIYLDPYWAVASFVEAPGLPTTILYSAAGEELARIPGEVDWDAPEVDVFLEAVLADYASG